MSFKRILMSLKKLEQIFKTVKRQSWNKKVREEKKDEDGQCF